MIKLLHPRLLGLLLIFLFATQLNYAQDVIHCWNFNGSGPFSSPVNTDNISSGAGALNGTITHNFVSGTAVQGAGNLSNACLVSDLAGSSFSVSSGAGLANNGRHVDFNFSTAGYEDIILSFYSRRIGSGFDNNRLEYSTDNGLNFTPFDFAPGVPFPLFYTPDGGSVESFNLSDLTLDVNNESDLVIRIIFGGATSVGGSNVIDNLKLEGTLANPNDGDSQVNVPGSQVPAKTIVAANTTTTPEAESVFSFEIEDLGSGDGVSTNVTLMQFVPGVNNTANWPDVVESLIMRDANGNTIPGTANVFVNEIRFTPDTPVTIPDNSSEVFTVDVVLNQTNIIDNSIMQFEILGIDADFQANIAGSFFASNFTGGNILGNEITIDVVASELRFQQQPTDVDVLQAMTPAVEVSLTDVNGNVDLSNTSLVEIVSSGDLDNSPLSVNAVAGIASFSSIVHNIPGENLILTASTADPFIVDSSSFNVLTNDETSEVVDPVSQISASTEVAATTTSLPVFSFDILDQGSGDGLSTTVTEMRFVAGPNNTADWTTTLSGISVQDAFSTNIPGTTVFNGNEIIFTPTTPVVIADGASDNFTVEVTLDQSNIVDNSVIQFQVDGTNSGFEAQFDGSLFSSSFSGGNVEGNNITLDVVATEIIFLQQPTDVEVNTFISPAVQVAYVDVNTNVDASITTDINLTSNGGVLESPLTPVPAVDGIATFPNIGYTAEALSVSLTAETTQTLISPATITSTNFDVISAFIAVQDFDGSTPEWTYTTSIAPFGNPTDESYFNEIAVADEPELNVGTDNIFGVKNLDSPNGTPGLASLDFATINITGFTNVRLSYNWEVSGFDDNDDIIQYEIFYDGVSQGLTDLFIGSSGNQDGSGFFLENIPDTAEEVSFQFFVQSNEETDYAGIDNVSLIGNSNARDTEIIQPIAGQVPAGTLIADINDDLANAVEVFSFDITDSGNFDNLPTTVTRLRFIPGADNTANWANVLQGISISDGTDSLDQANQTLTITSDQILIDINTDPDDLFEIDDATSKSYTVSIFLNETGITDQEVIEFAIDEGNENQLALDSGSIFSETISGFEGNEFLIDVVGDGLEFIVQPSNTVLGEDMAPAVRVADTDANGNLDLDSVGDPISISSSGTLDGDPVVENILANGFASFNNLQHTALGFGLTLTASATGFTDVVSDEFDITFEDNLLISEVAAPFVSGLNNPDLRFVELFNMSVDTLNFSEETYYLHNATSGNSVQLTGIIPPKSYYIISFADATTFSGLYGGVTPDLISSSVVTSDGIDAYYLSILNTEASLVDIHGTLADSGSRPIWDYSDGRYYRDIPNIRNSNSVFDETGEWIKETGISEVDPTPGEGDNDYVYSNDTDEWAPVGIGESPEGSSGGLNPGKSIFVEEGTVTLSNTNTISDVVVRDGATLILEGAITLNGDFANFGSVIFRSDEKVTAALGPFDAINRELVGTGYQIERFIPSNNRAFRYLSSSVNTTSSINDNWQEGVNNTGTVDVDPLNNLNPQPGFGTHITGSETGLNGFDATLTGNPSMFEWDVTNQEWDPIPNTDNETFTAGTPYSILIRGDRSTNLNSNSAVGPATTLRTTGRLVVGSRNVGNLASNVGGFSLIGNPYQAKVNLQTLLASGNATGVSSQFAYIYDPTLGSVGGYATVDLSDGSSLPAASGANQFLEPNQSFFVETTGPSQVVLFREPYKTTAIANNTTFSLPEDLTNLSINLYAEDVALPIDAVKVKFRVDGNNAKDTLDATKVWNYEEYFAIDRNPIYMSIESRAMPTAQDSIQIYFGNAQRTNYRFEVEPKNFSGAEVYVYDRYLDTKTEILNNTTTSIPFQMDSSIPESIATNRFVFKFEEVTLSDDENQLNTGVLVYPNPVKNGYFTVSHQQAFDGSDVDLKLFDLQGRMVIDKKIKNAPQVEVNLESNLSSGVYLLKLSDGNLSKTMKLIID